MEEDAFLCSSTSVLIEMPLRVSNITRVTFELINKGLFVSKRQPEQIFAWFQMLFDFVTNKRRLDGHLNFLAQIFELCS